MGGMYMKNKKRFTKLAALALAATMLAGNASVVSAQDVKDVKEATLRGALCLDCGYGQMVMKYGDWQNTGYGQVRCTHYPYGTDKVRYQERIIGSQCNYCGSYLKSRTEKRTIFLECHGYH